MRPLPIAAAVLMASTITDAFVPSNIGRPVMSLNLEDRIAKMIDGEVHRLNHKHEIDNERLQKQREWAKLEPTLPQGFDFEEGFTLESTSLNSASNHGRTEAVPGFSGMDRGPGSTVQRRKDERMASNDPARYCADRCVSTGNCDVFEDMFDLDPMEVLKFCKECVLSEDEDPCDVPDTFYEEDGKLHP